MNSMKSIRDELDDLISVRSPTPDEEYRVTPDSFNSSQSTMVDNDDDVAVKGEYRQKDKCKRLMNSVKRRMARLHDLNQRVSNLQEAIIKRQQEYTLCVKNKSKCGTPRSDGGARKKGKYSKKRNSRNSRKSSRRAHMKTARK